VTKEEIAQIGKIVTVRKEAAALREAQAQRVKVETEQAHLRLEQQCDETRLRLSSIRMESNVGSAEERTAYRSRLRRFSMSLLEKRDDAAERLEDAEGKLEQARRTLRSAHVRCEAFDVRRKSSARGAALAFDRIADERAGELVSIRSSLEYNE
jgi:hypothetical protein